MASTQPQSSKPYETLRSFLLSQPHMFYCPATSLPPLLINQSSISNSATPPPIASLSLHPALEATLHLLNRDLPSAHFLLRQSEAAPDYLSMYLHGILHRIEGDVDNARAWYGQVEGADEPEADVLESVWGRKERNDEGNGWRGFLDRVERWRDQVSKRQGAKKTEIDWETEQQELTAISYGELEKLLEICEKRFGSDEVMDASSVYTKHGDKKEKAINMVIGGEGWREF